MAKTDTHEKHDSHDPKKYETHKTPAPVAPPAHAAPVVATHAPVATPVAKRDPTKTIGIESGVEGEYLYIDAPDPGEHSRLVVIGDQSFEHTLTDGDGVWIYRRM
jgi:hypothetical protein